MKTVLATAYAINPFKGSEDGMGWNFILQIARFQFVVAITRKNNQHDIERFILENPDEVYQNIRFLYFDLPYWMRFWKKRGRGAMIYYLMWQFGVVHFIRKKKLHFDVVHNLNFHNDWSPSFLWKLKKPFVWGPIGHHPLIPNQYLAKYPKKYQISDRLTWWLKQFFWNLSPSLKMTISKANHILCMNESVPKCLKIKSKYSIMPSVATQDFGWTNEKNTEQKFTIISAGRFVPLKGFDLTIEAFAHFSHQLNDRERGKCQLILFGKGEEEVFLKNLVSKLHIHDQVQMVSWIDRHQLMTEFKKASAFLFPSHEGAGMVVAEALSFGLPIVCLDNEGPGQFVDKSCGFAIPHQDYENTIKSLSDALMFLFKNPDVAKKMSLAARKKFESDFNWDLRGLQLKKLYSEL